MIDEILGYPHSDKGIALAAKGLYRELARAGGPAITL
jgi:hypothetical protein